MNLCAALTLSAAALATGISSIRACKSYMDLSFAVPLKQLEESSTGGGDKIGEPVYSVVTGFIDPEESLVNKYSDEPSAMTAIKVTGFEGYTPPVLLDCLIVAKDLAINTQYGPVIVKDANQLNVDWSYERYRSLDSSDLPTTQPSTSVSMLSVKSITPGYYTLFADVSTDEYGRVIARKPTSGREFYLTYENRDAVLLKNWRNTAFGFTATACLAFAASYFFSRRLPRKL